MGHRMERTEAACAVAETAVSTVGFEQKCRECDYSLRGQPVFVRADMDLALVRCPECGTQQPTGRYMMSGKRAKRNETRDGLIWLLAYALMVCSIAGATGGLAQSTGFASCLKLGKWIGAHAPRRSAGFWDRSADSEWGRSDPDWWADGGRALLLERHPGVWSLTDWWVLTDLLWVIPIALGAGAWYRIMMRHATRRGHIAIGGSIMCLSLAVLIGYAGQVTHNIRTGNNYAMDLAFAETGFVVMFGSWVVIAGGVVVGLWRGADVLRFLILHLGGDNRAGWAAALERGNG